MSSKIIQNLSKIQLLHAFPAFPMELLGPGLVTWGWHLRLGLSHEGLIDADHGGYATGLTGAAFRGWIKVEP